MTVPQPANKGDRLPPWVIALLVIFLVLRVVDLLPARHSARLSQQLTGQVDEKTMQAMLSTNMTTKQAYIASLAKPGDAAPDPKGLRDALKSAETLQTGGQNSPGTARRVIILRALLRRPLFGPGKNGLDPKDAFAPSALTGLSPQESRRYAAEGRVWGAVARGPHLSPTQTDQDAAQLRALPNIRWWRAPAQAVLYRSQANPAQAARYDAQARTQALTTLGPLVGMILVYSLLGLAGVVLLIYLAIQWSQRKSPAPLPDPWPTMPELTPLAERRLRAGDLMGVFVLYLLMPDLIGWLLGGFSLGHHLGFPGLLSSYRRQLAASPGDTRVAANVVLSFVAYLVSAAVPVGLLIVIARRKRASIGEELGWNTHRLGRNLLYGVGGVCDLAAAPAAGGERRRGCRVAPARPDPVQPGHPAAGGCGLALGAGDAGGPGDRRRAVLRGVLVSGRLLQRRQAAGRRLARHRPDGPDFRLCPPGRHRRHAPARHAGRRLRLDGRDAQVAGPLHPRALLPEHLRDPDAAPGAGRMKPAPEEAPQTRLSVRLTPCASSDPVLRYADGVLFLRLTARRRRG